METGEGNPYAAPRSPSLSGGATIGGDAEAIRRRYLNNEASLRSYGTLLVLGGVAGLVVSVAGLVAAARPDAGIAPAIGSFLVGLLGFGQLFAGRKLRALDPASKTLATIFFALTLISIPVGTLIGGHALYLLHGEKGKVLLSPEYAAVREATPHIRYRMSPIVWLFVGLLVLVLLVVAAAAIGATR